MTISPFSCSCKTKKTHKLVFDGGVLGNYVVDLCIHCYRSQEKKFVIKEEMLDN